MLSNKKFPHIVQLNVNFEAVFFAKKLTIWKAKKTVSKLASHHMGKICISVLNRDKIWNLEGYIFEEIFTTEKLWDGLPVFWK